MMMDQNDSHSMHDAIKRKKMMGSYSSKEEEKERDNPSSDLAPKGKIDLEPDSVARGQMGQEPMGAKDGAHLGKDIHPKLLANAPAPHDGPAVSENLLTHQEMPQQVPGLLTHPGVDGMMEHERYDLMNRKPRSLEDRVKQSLISKKQ